MEKLEKRIGLLEGTVENLVKGLHELCICLSDGFQKIDANFLIIDHKIGEIRTDLNALKLDVNLLRGNSSVSFENVETNLSYLTLEISRINDVTQYEGIFNNLKIIKHNF